MELDQSLYARVFKYRGLLMVPPVLFTMFSHHAETEGHWVYWVGAIVFAWGLFGRIWAQMHLRYRLRVATKLTLTGPYAYVRNPIYISNTLMLVGMGFLSELVWFVPLMLLWCAVVYSATVRFEEYHLKGKYASEYEQFCVNVPRWIPKLPITSALKQSEPLRNHFWPSILAELHCWFLVIPYGLKEIFHS